MGVDEMRDEYMEENELLEDEEYEEEEVEEWEPEMQGFVQGWKQAGRYDKKEKHSEDFGEDFE